MVNKKVVVIGDGGCGKTCLSVVFSRNEFPEEHIPTIYDAYYKVITLEDRVVQLAIWDTAGEEDYDRLRPLSYTKADVIIICFAIDNLTSLENVVEKWTPEVRHYCNNIPLFLVGNKLDLRNNPKIIEDLAKRGRAPVKSEEGRKVAKKIKATYFECSAKHVMGVHNIFHKAAEIALSLETKSKRKCCCRGCCF